MSTDPGTLLNVSYIIYLPVTLYRSILNICIHLCYIPNCNFSGFFPFFFFFFQNVNATRKNSVALMKFKISFCFFLLCVPIHWSIHTCWSKFWKFPHLRNTVYNLQLRLCFSSRYLHYLWKKYIEANKGIVDEINKILSTFLKSYCAVIL